MSFDRDDLVSNPSSNATLASVLAARLSRRRLLAGGLAAAGATLLGPALRPAAAQNGLLGFASVPIWREDTIAVPRGYRAEVLYAWGDPISAGPAFRPDASNTVEDQEAQAGMHHDGLHFFPLPVGGSSSTHGLLAVNHEYTDDGLLHPGGMDPWTAEKVRKSQAAHGVSVVEARLDRGRWSVVRPSTFARRITGSTPIRLTGAAAGHAWLQTAADPTGLTALGTLNNCANGYTPWGTYLTCEENFNGYFVNRSAAVGPLQRRYGINERGFGYRWHEHDARFDAAAHPNEPNRFGWVVEIDPYDPHRPAVKHTALGRFKHEGAALAMAGDGRVVFYMGDDERFEYVYKFVSRDAWTPGMSRAAGMRLLEHGTLYAARFDADGTGEWRALAHGLNGLDAGAGFPSQAEVLINARRAADVAGATKMDRPEWIAVHPRTSEAYVALTNNANRGKAGSPAPDAANPRAENVFGHIVRWRERGGAAAGTRFDWDVFLLCGDPTLADAGRHGTIKGDVFGSPDGLWFDARGVLWIQTDVSTSVLHKGDYAGIGNNQMLAADPATREVRRFLTGPGGCEITGVTVTPDGTSLFVNVQHPGETASERSNPAAPKAVSSWPDGPAGGRPRSATLVIRKTDGGLLGT
ncbi:MAG TPA: PhoX family phosphatase [Candidatus Limnocylindrales bacterium]|nr:PhoX family phosphatase [Candidatus Limnocylindrales bacterium]